MHKPTVATSKRMVATRGRDNPRELVIRSALHRLGLRFRIHRRLIDGSTRTADIAFARAKVVVFLDGCFWHGCPKHGTFPKTNSEWWRQKILANLARDRDTDATLEMQGWKVIRIWEHVPVDAAVKAISSAVRKRL